MHLVIVSPSSFFLLQTMEKVGVPLPLFPFSAAGEDGARPGVSFSPRKGQVGDFFFPVLKNTPLFPFHTPGGGEVPCIGLVKGSPSLFPRKKIDS